MPFSLQILFWISSSSNTYNFGKYLANLFKRQVWTTLRTRIECSSLSAFSYRLVVSTNGLPYIPGDDRSSRLSHGTKDDHPPVTWTDSRRVFSHELAAPLSLVHALFYFFTMSLRPEKTIILAVFLVKQSEFMENFTGVTLFSGQEWVYAFSG